MTTPISFTVRPPSAAPHRPSPLGNGGASSRSGPPSRRLFEASNGDDEDEDENGDDSYSRRSRPREERIDGFGRDGKATGGQKPEGPLVIPALPNRDWRQSSSRRTPSYRPDARRQESAKQEDDRKPDRINDEPQRSGLRFAIKPEQDQEDVKPDLEKVTLPTASGSSTNGHTTEDIKPDVDRKPLTLEEQALQALLAGDHTTESDAERAQREMVIESERNREIGAWSEEDALQRDLDALPDESTRDDYNTVPIEAFGMAMLRGMGWNPNDDSNTKIHVPKARPGQLGLGATPMSEVIPPSHDRKSRREDRAKRGGRGYNASGAMIKREIGGSATPTATSSSSRRPSPDGETDSDASKRRRRDGDYDSGSSRRREKERDDRDRYETEDERARRKAKERAREKEYETEEERARRKAKERERDRDRDDRYSNGGDRDGRRDRYDDRDRDRRDRDRDRDRDRERDYRR